MANEFTAVLEHAGEWFIGYSPEIPGANGQGKSKMEALDSLSAAISLILADRREDAFVGFRQTPFGRRSPSSEARRPAGRPQAARVLSEAGRGESLPLV